MSPEHSVVLEKVGKVMQMGLLNKEYSYVKSLCRMVPPLHKVAKIISPVPIMCLLALTFSESLHWTGAIYVGSTLGSIVIFPLFTTRYNKCHFFFSNVLGVSSNSQAWDMFAPKRYSLPNTLRCHEMEQIFRRAWWGRAGVRRQESHFWLCPWTWSFPPRSLIAPCGYDVIRWSNVLSPFAGLTACDPVGRLSFCCCWWNSY